MINQDPIEWFDANGVGHVTGWKDCQDWDRDRMRPFSKAIAFARNDGVSKTNLHNATASAQRDYIFTGAFSNNGYTFGNLATYQESPSLPSAKNGESDDDLFALIENRLNKRNKLAAGVNEQMLNERIGNLQTELKAYLDSLQQPTRVEVYNRDTEERKDLGVQHFRFPSLLAWLRMRMHCALVGPAGTGKTEGARQAALALGLEFRSISVGAQTTKSDLVGYMDASGRYVSTVIRESFEFGGVVLLDEFDAANANVATVLNAITANSHAGFPDGKLVGRHKDFIVIVAMNTFGRGADREYVGRNQLDAATITRFKFISWDQDDALELALCVNTDWCKYVQAVRKSAAKVGIRHVISPRASYDGAKALADGVLSRDEVEFACIWQGLKETEKAKVIAGLEVV
jgi:hypothetical protein